MFDSIDKNTLKPGDVVGIRVKTQIGWGFFRYPKTIRIGLKNNQKRHLGNSLKWIAICLFERL